MGEVTFEGQCEAVRVVSNPRRDPTQEELARLRAQWVHDRRYARDRAAAVVVTVLVGLLVVGALMPSFGGSVWGVSVLVVAMALAAERWVRDSRGYLLGRWRRAQATLVASGALGPTSLEVLEAPVRVTLHQDASRMAVSWEVDEASAVVLGVRPAAAGGGADGESSGYGVASVGAVGLERRALRFELTRRPHVPERFALLVRPEGDGDRVSSDRGLVLELDASHLVSDAAGDALPALERRGIRLSPQGAEMLLGQLRPIAEALGSPLPRALGESRREVAPRPAPVTDMDGIFEQFGTLFKDMFNRKEPATSGGADILMDVELSLKTAVEGGRIEQVVDGYALCDGCRGVGEVVDEDPRRCKACGGTGKVKANHGFVVMTTSCEACRGSGYGLRKACRSCEGAGHTRHKETLKVTIPAGVNEGTKIRLRGKGLPGTSGVGDLYLEVRVKPETGVVRDGRNLHVELPLDAEALRSGTVHTIQVLGRPVEVRVPPLTAHEAVVRVAGQGGLRVAEPERGDLFVRVLAGAPQTR